MTDFCTRLRQGIAAMATELLGVQIHPAQIDCPVQGSIAYPFVARSAAPLLHQADAALWAETLRQGAHAYTLLDTPYIQDIRSNGGHLLFSLTDSYYTALLRSALVELPALENPDCVTHEDAALARIHYTQRRMWMLARHAEGDIYCPPAPEVQRALLLTVATCEQGITARALILRLLAASDALLTMTHCVLPRQRPALCKQCGYVGQAAARIFALSVQNQP